MTDQRQPPVPPPAVALTFDLISLAQVGDMDRFKERLEEVQDAIELSATLEFLRFYKQEDFAQALEARRDQLMLAKLPKAEGDGKGAKRL